MSIEQVRHERRDSIYVTNRSITDCEVDAIVTAANIELAGGGGVDGAIHKAAGPDLLRACQELPVLFHLPPDARERRVRPNMPGAVRCPVGSVRATPSFGALKARYVLHAVGPIWGLHENAFELLASAYRKSFELARLYDCKSLALPAISCGVYQFPVTEAAAIAIKTAHMFRSQFERIEFPMVTAETYAAFRDALISYFSFDER